jgi:signal transduction histidine kinase
LEAAVMRMRLFAYHSGLLVALGALVAIACLACSWYINRLQSDLAHTVRHDAAGMEAAVELQVQLRNLRVHSLVLAADGADPRREVVRADLSNVDAAIREIQHTAVNAEDTQLANQIAQDYADYKAHLHLDDLPLTKGSLSDLAEWSDKHHMSELIALCRNLVDSQRGRMKSGLERSETQTVWAGRVLIVLGIGGVLAGLMSGYVTARAWNRRVAQLLVRVQAVQAHLDQDVAAMTLRGTGDLADLEEQLGLVVDRVSQVCRRVQEQERELLRAEQLAAVGQLAAGVAHEIRNPLTGVKLLLQGAVRPNNPTPLTTDRLHLLLQEIARIERTVQGLMDFSVAPPLNRHPHDVNLVVAESVKVAQARADLKSVAIRFEAFPRPVLVSMDQDRFLSLLTNLLFNAIDATPAGGDVLVSTTCDRNGMIQVVVADTGPGIQDKLANQLFTPFSTSKPTGTGLGLTIARRVAQEHGGTLTATQRPEGGACFTLTISTAEQANGEALGS